LAEEGFLPPEPPGPEPELGPKPSPAPQPPQPQAPSWQPPLTGGPTPPPQQQWQPQPGGAGQPPVWQPPPPGWAQPPPGQGWAQQPWAYASPQPDNGPAVTGFVLAMVSIGLWLFSAGMSSLLSLGLAIGGLVASRRGKRNVASGHTPKHKGLAQAGFVCNIVMIVLSTLSTIFWAIFWIAFATDEDFRRDIEDDDGGGFGGDGISTTVRVGALAVRLTSALLS
jgi:hypothetical protein